MLLVVTYDVSDDRRRNRLAKKLEDYGLRVQYSVFECLLDDERAGEMVEKLKEFLSEDDEDSLRVYAICEACRKRARIHGSGALTADPEVYIV